MNMILVRAGLTLAGIFVSSMAQAQGFPDRTYMWDGGWGWGHMIFGSAMMVVFWGVIILLIVLAVRWLGSAGHGAAGPAGKTAVDILKERFARGEIDKTEFEDRRRALGD